MTSSNAVSDDEADLRSELAALRVERDRLAEAIRKALVVYYYPTSLLGVAGMWWLPLIEASTSTPDISLEEPAPHPHPKAA